MAFIFFSGKGVDIVYDAVGGPTSIETLRCVNFGARFCIVGWTSTPFVAKGKAKALVALTTPLSGSSVYLQKKCANNVILISI